MVINCIFLEDREDLYILQCFYFCDSHPCDLFPRVCPDLIWCFCLHTEIWVFVFFQTNVVGHNCDTCKPNTFGLSVKNPFGCSRCYCYGLTQSCSEAQGLIRMWVSRLSSLAYKLRFFHTLSQIPCWDNTFGSWLPITKFALCQPSNVLH